MCRWALRLHNQEREVWSLPDLDHGATSMYQYFVGLDVHKQVIAYCIKAADGAIIRFGTSLTRHYTFY